MKIIEANEGPKIHYEESGTWINFDDQIMLNLKKSEADHDVHIDITSDAFGRLNTGAGYVNKTITKREPLPFSMENVTVTLFALKEGVF